MRLASLTTDANGLYRAPLGCRRASTLSKPRCRGSSGAPCGPTCRSAAATASSSSSRRSRRRPKPSTSPPTRDAPGRQRRAIHRRRPRQLESLPIASHDFQQFLALVPGVNGTRRIGGGGQDNYMIDGVSAMDTGNNGLMGGLNLPVDAIAEVKVLTSAYQAEYGRSSGLQISAVTRSGTNQFKFSVFSYQRPAPFVNNMGRRAERLPGRLAADRHRLHARRSGRPARRRQPAVLLLQPRVPAAAVRHFVRSCACRRRSSGAATSRRRATRTARCSTSSTIRVRAAEGRVLGHRAAACFQDGGVLGRIPPIAVRPGHGDAQPVSAAERAGASGQGFNYAVVTPVQFSLAHTPVIRFDYQALSRLRLTGKWAGQTSLVQPTYNTLPGFDDTLQKFPLSFNTSVTATSPRPVDLPRSDLRPQPEPARRAAGPRVTNRDVVCARRPRGAGPGLHGRRAAAALP